MLSTADTLGSSTNRRLPLRLRADLVVRRQLYQGQVSYAVKEPLGPGYFRFKEEDFALLEMLDGRASLDELKQRFERRYPYHHMTSEQLWQFISTLHRSNLLVSDTPDQGRQLKKRHDQRRRKELLGKLTNVLAIRFRGFDPERLLNRLYPLVRPFFSVPAVVASCLLGISALLLVLVQFDVFVARLPAFHQFFGLANAPWLLLALVITKVLHEFGHGLTCKHFGGECHEIGVLLLVLTPCMYCNVSDSWMLPNKWHRMAIGAAGMYVELVLASLCTLVWWFSEPGFLNYLCLYIMFISSVSTVVFNANPLLRYDGYYILSDGLEIPNLKQKADAVLQRTLAWWSLGLEPPSDRYLPPRHRGLFMLFAISSAVYRWLVLYFILWFLAKMLEPYRLEIIGHALALVSIVGLVGLPLWKLGQLFYVPGRWEQVKRPRLAISLSVVAALAAGMLLIPLRHAVLCPLEIKPHGAMPVYVEVPGSLKRLHVKTGDHVEAGATLADLENTDLEIEIAQLTQQRDQQAAQLKTLQRSRFSDRQALSQIPQVAAALHSREEQLAKRLAERQTLVLTAPCEGWVLPPPEAPPKASGEGRLSGWSGTPLDAKNLGCLLQTNTLFCQIGDPRKLEAVLVVDQADIELVAEGDRVELKLDELPQEKFHGTITSIAKAEMQFTPPQLSTKAGGELATQSDESGHERPQSTSYQARVLLEDEANLLRAGLRGRAKIHTAPRTLGQRVWRYFNHTFRFGI
jgi:putative peptide zinc metalloprotease protein